MYMKRIFVISLSILLFLCGCQTEDTEVINSFYKDIISLSENQTIYDLDEIGECSSNIIGISEKTLERSEHFQKENIFSSGSINRYILDEKLFGGMVELVVKTMDKRVNDVDYIIQSVPETYSTIDFLVLSEKYFGDADNVLLNEKDSDAGDVGYLLGRGDIYESIQYIWFNIGGESQKMLDYSFSEHIDSRIGSLIIISFSS